MDSRGWARNNFSNDLLLDAQKCYAVRSAAWSIFSIGARCQEPKITMQKYWLIRVHITWEPGDQKHRYIALKLDADDLTDDFINDYFDSDDYIKVVK
jgi:hypothetical protein